MLEADYLIVGAGAVGMIFADQIVSETGARIVMVDRHALPGGHWNDAYPFVRLHQPSAYYGAGSRRLGGDRIDDAGLNKGYYEQASGAEVSAYFDALMRERFLPSGRVRYFPMCEYAGDGKFVSRLSGAVESVKFRKLVDATFFNTQTPATHTPAFKVAPGVKIAAPHLLAQTPGGQFLGTQFPGREGKYVIVGAGKTGMDVAVWLLQMGVAPEAVRWIAPRDSWLINREITQPGEAFLQSNAGGLARQLEAAAEASDLDDLFARLERDGQLLRIDPGVRPSMYRGATMSQAEVEVLRTIKDVVRKGHVRAIERHRIVLDDGDIETAPDWLHIDCSARALSRRPSVEVFAPGAITIQMVRAQLISISAAVIAHVEAAYGDDSEKNELCRPIPPASSDADWARGMLDDLRAAKRWSADKPLRRWVGEHRLSGFGAKNPADPHAQAIAQAINGRIREARPRAEANLARLLAALELQ